jgi:aspartate/methionine/tyrosine aminotransferase
MFSQRSAFDRRSNRLEQAKSRAQAEGRALLDLTVSNPTLAELPALPRALTALSHPDGARYQPEPFGLRSAREAASHWLVGQGLRVPPEQIVLTASTSEAYAYLLKLFCDPGDDVLVAAPSYPLFEHLARLESVGILRYGLRYDGRWHLPQGALALARGPRTRAVLAVHPNNPTGSYLKQGELAELAALGLPIVSDEVFAPYPLGPDPERACPARAENALVCSLHGLSKLAGLPQLKLAWIAVTGPAALVAETLARLELIADAFLSVATPVQLALPEILAACAPRTEATCARLARNHAALRRLTQKSAVTPLHVEGGWYAIVQLPSLLDDEAWAVELLERRALLVQPGYFYDFEPGSYLVLSLLTPEPAFEEGIARLCEHVSTR